MNNMLI